jgi:hypothetical protein
VVGSLGEAQSILLETPDEASNDIQILGWSDKAMVNLLRPSTEIDHSSNPEAFSTWDPEGSSLPLNATGIIPSLDSATGGGGEALAQTLTSRGRTTNHEVNDADVTARHTSTPLTSNLPREASLFDPAASLLSLGPEPEPQPRTVTDGEWLQRLVKINVRLFNHTNQALNQTLLPGDIDHCIPIANAFDETIVLSLQFLQTMRELHGTSSQDLPIHTAASPAPNLDSGTTLIIYSCYVRVLQLFIDRLGAIRGTINAATTAYSAQHSNDGSPPVASSVPPLVLPTLEACSCSLEKFPILRIRMTLEVIEEILDVMSALLLPIVRVSGGRAQQEEERAMPWRGQSLLPEVSQQALLAREEKVYQIIRGIRRELKTSRRALM